MAEGIEPQPAAARQSIPRINSVINSLALICKIALLQSADFRNVIAAEDTHEALPF